MDINMTPRPLDITYEELQPFIAIGITDDRTVQALHTKHRDNADILTVIELLFDTEFRQRYNVDRPLGYILDAHTYQIHFFNQSARIYIDVSDTLTYTVELSYRAINQRIAELFNSESTRQ